MASRKMMFLMAKPYGLEGETIAEIVTKHEDVAEVKEIQQQLMHSPDEYLMAELGSLVKDYDVYLIGVPTERFHDLATQMIQLSDDGVAGGMSVITQVAALTHHRMDSWEKLVATFADGGIEGMHRHNIDRSDIRLVLLRDRLARGATMRDENTAASVLAKHPKPYLSDYMGAVYLFPQTCVEPHRIDLAVLDGLDRYGPKATTVIFVGEECLDKTSRLSEADHILRAKSPTGAPPKEDGTGIVLAARIYTAQHGLGKDLGMSQIRKYADHYEVCQWQVGVMADAAAKRGMDFITIVQKPSNGQATLRTSDLAEMFGSPFA